MIGLSSGSSYSAHSRFKTVYSATMTKRRSARQRRLPGSPPRIAVATSTAPTTLSGHDAAMPSQAPSRAAMRWTSRIVPVFIFVAFGYAIYAIIPYICGMSSSPRPALPRVLRCLACSRLPLPTKRPTWDSNRTDSALVGLLSLHDRSVHSNAIHYLLQPRNRATQRTSESCRGGAQSSRKTRAGRPRSPGRMDAG